MSFNGFAYVFHRTNNNSMNYTFIEIERSARYVLEMLKPEPKPKSRITLIILTSVKPFQIRSLVNCGLSKEFVGCPVTIVKLNRFPFTIHRIKCEHCQANVFYGKLYKRENL